VTYVEELANDLDIFLMGATKIGVLLSFCKA
jgi:hypothetical protein